MATRAKAKKPEPKKRGRGRPTVYRPEFAQQAAKLCALGATDYELGQFFGVDTATIYRWKNTRDDFCDALTCGKEKADERVKRSLFNRAVGYTFESEKVFQHQGQIFRAETVEHVPPDPSAAKLWLTNRCPEEWRESARIEHTGRDGGPIETVTRIELVAASLPGGDEAGE